MKRAMAAPERMDLFPISCESNPKVAFPPKEEHVVCRISRTCVLVIRPGFPLQAMVLMVVAPVALDLASVSEDWAKCSVPSSTLCSGIHFLIVLLICKCDSDMLSFGEQIGVVVINDSVGCGSEHQAVEIDAFRLTRSRGLGVLA
jgi:hypothetical protein